MDWNQYIQSHASIRISAISIAHMVHLVDGIALEILLQLEPKKLQLAVLLLSTPNRFIFRR